MSDERYLDDFIEAETRLSELMRALDPLLPVLRYISIQQTQLAKLEEELLKSRRHYADALLRYPQVYRK